MKVACLGPKGSFTSSVTEMMFPNAELQYTNTYHGCQGVKNRELDYALYPLENNTGGFVTDTVRSLYQTSKISIVGMETLKIQQNLISHCQNLEDIEAIYTHPQAIAQCQKQIEKLEALKGSKIQLVKLSSTSEGIIAAAKDHSIAAIGSISAANLYGVSVLKENFQDKSRNETRFAVMKMGASQREEGEYKTMFLLEFHNSPGAFSQTLALIGSLDIDILALTTQPVYKECGPLEYAFFLEVRGHIADEKLGILHKTLLGRRLSGQSRKARWIGSYLDKEVLMV